MKLGEKTLFKLAPVIIGIILLSLVYQYYSGVSYREVFTGQVTIDASCNANVSVSLGVGEAIVNDGDAFIGENTINPDWIWVLSDLTNYTDATNFSRIDGPSGPFIGIESNFTRIGSSQNPITEGSCYDLPRNHASVCFTSYPSVSETLSIGRELNYNTTASGWGEGLQEVNVTRIAFLGGNLILKTNDWIAVNSSNDPIGKNITEIILQPIGPVSDNISVVYYVDSNLLPTLRHAGNISLNKSILAQVNFSNTDENNILIQTGMIENSENQFNIVLNISGDNDYELGPGEEEIYINFTKGDNAVLSLGAVENILESKEIRWTSYSFVDQNIGTALFSRSLYGILIVASIADPTVSLFFIPPDQIQANITIGDISEDIPIGKVIVNETYGFNWTFNNNTITSLQNNTITFDGNAVRIHDELILNRTGSPSIETSLSSGDSGYLGALVMETERLAIKYGYFFDDALNISNVTVEVPLSINVLGGEINISELGSATSFKSYDSVVNPILSTISLNSSNATVNIFGVELEIIEIKAGSVIVKANGTQREIVDGEAANLNGTIVSVQEISGCLFSIDSEPPPPPPPEGSGPSRSKYKTTFSGIDAFENEIVRISKRSLHVTGLEFIVRDDFFDVDLKVTKLNRLPSVIPKPNIKDVNIYQYFEVDFEKLIKSDFIKSDLMFRVKESWVDNRGFNNERNVRLMKFDGGWVELDTVLDFKDDTYLYYAAETDGFSYFAMVLTELEPLPPSVEIPLSLCGNGIRDPGETCSNCGLDFICSSGRICQGGICTVIEQPPPTRPRPSPPPIREEPGFFDQIGGYWLYIAIGAAILVLVGVIIFMVRGTKKNVYFSRTALKGGKKRKSK